MLTRSVIIGTCRFMKMSKILRALIVLVQTTMLLLTTIALSDIVFAQDPSALSADERQTIDRCLDRLEPAATRLGTIYRRHKAGRGNPKGEQQRMLAELLPLAPKIRHAEEALSSRVIDCLLAYATDNRFGSNTGGNNYGLNRARAARILAEIGTEEALTALIRMAAKNYSDDFSRGAPSAPTGKNEPTNSYCEYVYSVEIPLYLLPSFSRSSNGKGLDSRLNGTVGKIYNYRIEPSSNENLHIILGTSAPVWQPDSDVAASVLLDLAQETGLPDSYRIEALQGLVDRNYELSLEDLEYIYMAAFLVEDLETAGLPRDSRPVLIRVFAKFVTSVPAYETSILFDLQDLIDAFHFNKDDQAVREALEYAVASLAGRSDIPYFATELYEVTATIPSPIVLESILNAAIKNPQKRYLRWLIAVAETDELVEILARTKQKNRVEQAVRKITVALDRDLSDAEAQTLNELMRKL